MYGFVYIWRDRDKDRYYIGSHYGREDDSYISSNKWMNAAYKKRPHSFRRRILYRLQTPDLSLLQEVEQYWLDLIPKSCLSTSKNVTTGTNFYYNMKKVARGGNGQANKNKSKPAQNRWWWHLISPSGEHIQSDRLYEIFPNSPGIGQILRLAFIRNRPIIRGKYKGWSVVDCKSVFGETSFKNIYTPRGRTKPAWNKGLKQPRGPWSPEVREKIRLAALERWSRRKELTRRISNPK